jgi:hypothetical protein
MSKGKHTTFARHNICTPTQTNIIIINMQNATRAKTKRAPHEPAERDAIVVGHVERARDQVLLSEYDCLCLGEGGYLFVKGAANVKAARTAQQH